MIRLMNTYLDGGLYDTDIVETVGHVLQTGCPGFNYTHQQLKFTNHLNILSGIRKRKQGIL